LGQYSATGLPFLGKCYGLKLYSLWRKFIYKIWGVPFYEGERRRGPKDAVSGWTPFDELVKNPI
jgi:hypothetical protein